MHPLFEKHDLRALPGRILAIGDVHGCFSRLRDGLEAIGYDPDADRLVLLGDLVDRGPESHEVLEWTHHLRVLGNHEIMTRDAYERPAGNTAYHERYGGEWFTGLTDDQRAAIVEGIMDAPVAIQITTPAGHKVGFVHAGVPMLDWKAFKKILKDKDHPNHDKVVEDALWSREHVNAVRDRKVRYRIPGIDHVFMGHTIHLQPLVHLNMSFIDTGATRHDNITIVDVDAWIKEAVSQFEIDTKPC